MGTQTLPYSLDQVKAYLALIDLPKRFWPDARPSRDFAMLKALHIHAISTHPYENLSLHYSPSIVVSLKPEHIYEKFMHNGRGGYCFEHGIFFNHILRATGFSAYMVGVRIRMRVDGVPVGDYSGWRHVVNIVTLGDGLKYMVDVGFGGDGPIQPLPVLDGHVVQNIGTQELRLVHSHIPPQTLLGERNKMWIYQYRNGPEREWNSFYAFPELEFFSPDFEIINYFISHSPESFQTYRLLVVKFLRAHSKDSDSYIHGKVMLVNDQVKLNTGGRTSVVQTCRTEAERVKALEKHFGITLKDKERRGIEGRSTELGKQADFDAST